MKIKHECLSCTQVWYPKVKETSCPNCPESTVVHSEIIDFRDQPQGSSLKRQACYSITHGKDGTLITGRSPRKDDIRKGTILTGIPYGNFQGFELKVKTIKYRPHKGVYGDLWHWSAKCEI